MSNQVKEKNPLLECGDCFIELKEGEGKLALDGSILCAECLQEEKENERLSEEMDEVLLSEDIENERESYIESLQDDKLDSLEDY
jgi:hypothetical protein